MNPESQNRSSTAFNGVRRMLSGPLGEVALAVKAAVEGGLSEHILVFDDTTGRVIDLDLRGTQAEVIERLSRPRSVAESSGAEDSGAIGLPRAVASDSRGRGRPKLGVVAREVTLLPRHWEWLASQPGGASAALRRLVDDARRQGGERLIRRAAQEAAYQFMYAIAGDLPGYEEASRALFADDQPRLEHWVAAWPPDIREYLLQLAFAVPPRPPRG